MHLTAYLKSEAAIEGHSMAESKNILEGGSEVAIKLEMHDCEVNGL